MTVTANSSGSPNWLSVGTVKLRVTNCYSKINPLRLKEVVHFASCPFGGPIALAYSNSCTTSWFISLRTCDGNILKSEIEVPDVFAMEWTLGQRLVIVDRRGHVSVFSPKGQLENEFALCSSVREVRNILLFSTTFDSGIAMLDDQHRLFVVNSVFDPVVWNWQINSSNPVTTWTAMQPLKEQTRLIVIQQRDFYSASPGEQLSISDTPWALVDGQYSHASVSADRLKLAFYHSSGLIQVVTADLSNEISKITVSGDLSLYRFGWLGEECFFIQRTATFIQLYSIREQDMSYDLPTGVVHVGVEVDGIRLFTEDSVQFIDIVSKEEQEVMGVASAADGALLHEAAQWLKSGRSHQSYEYATQIRDMQLAIASCIKAATDSWVPELQKSLLNAARFGMAFTTFDTSKFMRVVRELRLLNAVRGKQVGLPLSYTQFTHLKSSSLVNRLIDLEKYGMAIEIHKWIEGDSLDGVDRVLMEWVKRVVQAAANQKNNYEMDFSTMDRQISNKLANFKHVSIAGAAEKAIEAKLPKLARLLIKRETSDYKQIQVLLNLDDVQEALAKAAAAQKPQLMHQVVRHLMKKHRKADYELSIRKIPMALCVYQDLVREEHGGQTSGRQMLALLEQASDFELQTLFHMDCSSDKLQTTDNRLNSLRCARDSAHNLGDRGIEDVISELASFVPSQIERSQEHLTIRDTVIHFAANASKVNVLKNQAKLTDKQIWLWTIEGLARSGKLEHLWSFSQKKSPIGYVPFIKACVKYNHTDECKKYFEKLTGIKDKIEAYTVMGNYVTAAQLAYSRRDGEALTSIYNKAHRDRASRMEIGKLINSL